jgi:hypothetical protein
MSANQVAVTIDDISEANAPAIYVAGGLGRFLEAVTAEVTAEVPDLTTRKGRERIASLAAKVSKSKAAVEKPGRDYLKRLKEMPKVVEAELREFVSSMDALRDATRQPLTDWEKAEDARIDKHNDAIERIRLLSVDLDGITAEDLVERVAQLEAIALGDAWEEFEAEAARAKDKALGVLRAALTARQQYEAEQAELAKLRAEAEARAKADHEAAIAKAAAEQARIEAEQRAQAERDAAAKREQALIDQAAQAQRDAEQKAREAEAAAANQALQLKLAAEQAERQALQAEADRVEGIRRAEQQSIEAAKRQAEAVEQARLAEIARQKAITDENLRQQKAREADAAHKSKIMGAAKEALMSLNITEELAKAIVLKIARREVPNVTIQF